MAGTQVNKSRGWCFTDYDDVTLSKDEYILRFADYTYLVVGREVCPTTSKIHWQGCIEYPNARHFTRLHRDYPNIHWEKRKGSINANVEYCTKDGDYIESGTKPVGQGSRTDLLNLRTMLLNGTNVNDIVITDPYAYHTYGRTLERIETIRLSQTRRNGLMPRCIWYWGPTGVGKSHMLFNHPDIPPYNPDTHYLWAEDNGWWDDYNGHPYVLINEFRGQIPYSLLLTLTDKWDCKVKRRNRPARPWLAEVIIVSSPMHPQDVYHGVISNEDHIDQLLRRFEIIHLSIPYGGTGTGVVTGNTTAVTTTTASSEASVAVSHSSPSTFDGLI